MGTEIRKAKKGDLKEISEIFRKESSKKPYLQKWTKKTALKKIKEFFKKDDIHLAMIEKKIVGFITLRISLGEKGKGAFIKELWLKSNYQRKGIGKNLMNFVENKYKNEGINSIFLISNKKARAFGFYKKLRYKTYNDFVLMGKKLNK